MNKPKINYKIKVIENVGNFLKSNDTKDIVSSYFNDYDIILNIVQNDKIVQKYKKFHLKQDEKDFSKLERIVAGDVFKKYLNDVLFDRKELLLKIFDLLNLCDIDDNVYQLINLTNTNLDGSVFINGIQKFFIDAKEILDDVDIRTLFQYNTEINIFISVDSRFIEGIFI